MSKTDEKLEVCSKLLGGDGGGDFINPYKLKKKMFKSLTCLIHTSRKRCSCSLNDTLEGFFPSLFQQILLLVLRLANSPYLLNFIFLRFIQRSTISTVP